MSGSVDPGAIESRVELLDRVDKLLHDSAQLISTAEAVEGVPILQDCIRLVDDVVKVVADLAHNVTPSGSGESIRDAIGRTRRTTALLSPERGDAA